jgi:hypothetical protein
MSLPTEIPKNEVENILDIYWQMLTTLESKINPKKDILDKQLVQAAHTVLNRIKQKTKT